MICIFCLGVPPHCLIQLYLNGEYLLIAKSHLTFDLSSIKTWGLLTELYPYIPEWWAAAAKHWFMFASPRVGSRAKNKIHKITMFILVDIFEDILEYYVQVRIII